MLATRAVIGRCPCSIRVQINRDVIENLFSLFCSKWRAVLKTFARLFQIKVSESRSYLQRRKIEKRIQKGLLTTWKCLNYRNIHNSCHRVSSLRETPKKNNKWHTRLLLRCHFFVFTIYILTSSVIYYRTDARQFVKFSMQAKDDYQGKHTYWAILPSVSCNAAAVVTKFTSRAICSIFTGCVGTVIYTKTKQKLNYRNWYLLNASEA